MSDNILKVRQKIKAIAAFKRTPASVSLRDQTAVVFCIGNSIGWCYIAADVSVGDTVTEKGVTSEVLFVWPQPSEMTAGVLKAIMHRGHFQIVGKLSQMEVTSLSLVETQRAFAGVGSRTYCNDILNELISWGLTHSMLDNLCTPSK